MADRFVCTKDNPFTPEKAKPFGGFVSHPDAKCVDEDYDWYDGDCTEYYECPNCGEKFKVLIPR